MINWITFYLVSKTSRMPKRMRYIFLATTSIPKSLTVEILQSTMLSKGTFHPQNVFSDQQPRLGVFSNIFTTNFHFLNSFSSSSHFFSHTSHILLSLSLCLSQFYPSPSLSLPFPIPVVTIAVTDFVMCPFFPFCSWQILYFFIYFLSIPLKSFQGADFIWTISVPCPILFNMNASVRLLPYSSSQIIEKSCCPHLVLVQFECNCTCAYFLLCAIIDIHHLIDALIE